MHSQPGYDFLLSAASPPDRRPCSAEQSLKVYDLMLRTRLLEERLIAMYKQGDAYFWIGGPGEEAFNVPLGMLVNKGSGVDHNYLHLHYRSSGTLLAGWGNGREDGAALAHVEGSLSATGGSLAMVLDIAICDAQRRESPA